jgi:hypothetical protein
MQGLETFSHIVLHLILELGWALLIPVVFFYLVASGKCCAAEEDYSDDWRWPDPS